MKQFSNKQGSALLIVLGLLSFLMISAIAFTLSMRTENASASVYRKQVVAQELLTMAFGDARAAVEKVMVDQAEKNGVRFPLADDKSRNVYTLTPFAIDGNPGVGYGKPPVGKDITNNDPNNRPNWSFARVMASAPSSYRQGDTDEDEVAYLIDEQTLNHIPPYIANAVYNSLERNNNGEMTNKAIVGGESPFALYNAPAHWKPIRVENRDATMTLGRMAWAAINLSDAIDINAITHLDETRGLGLAACDLALASTNQNDPNDDRKLLDKQGAWDAQGGFLTTADFTRGVLFGDTAVGNSFIPAANHWAEAIYTTDYNDDQSESLFAPFTTYSYWPVSDRKVRNNKSPSSKKIYCSDVGDLVKGNSAKALGNKLKTFVTDYNDDMAKQNTPDKRITFSTEQIESIAASIKDYVDEDSSPSDAAGDNDEILALYTPNAEAFPMVAALNYDWDGLQGQIESSSPKGNARLVDNDAAAEIDIKDVLKKVSSAPMTFYSAFPYRNKINESFNFDAIANWGVALIDQNKDLVAATTLEVQDNADSISTRNTPTGPWRYQAHEIDLTPSGTASLKVTLPVNSADDEIKASYTFLVEAYVKAQVSNKDGIVDMAPVGDPERTYTRAAEFKAEYAPAKKLNKKWTRSRRLDQGYFRVTFAYTLSLTCAITRTEEDGVKKVDISDPEIEITQLKGGAADYRLSKFVGHWVALDPRYNWLSPMMGCSATSLRALCDSGDTVAQCSSQQWIFGDEIQFNQGSEILDLGYIKQVGLPFLATNDTDVKNIFFSSNNSGQMFFPAEVGLVPYPLTSSAANQFNNDYDKTITDSYIKEYHKAYWRTIPVVSYTDKVTGAVAQSQIINAFTCETPGYEEHRGLISAFAGQDNVYLSNNLRKIALQGMPGSIAQAARVTVSRQTANSDKLAYKLPNIDKVNVSTLPEQSPTTESPYAEFIEKYLFTNAAGNVDPEWDNNKNPRPFNRDFMADPKFDLAGKVARYNQKYPQKQLGLADVTQLYAMSREIFGDRQQLFLYVATAEFITIPVGKSAAKAPAQSRAKAIALIWRDGYGYLPDRVIYVQSIY